MKSESVVGKTSYAYIVVHGKFRLTYWLHAVYNTVLISVWHGRCMRSVECRLVIICAYTQVTAPFCCVFAVLMLSSSDEDDTAAVFGGSVARFVEDSEFTYEDFARRGEKPTIPTFRASDFSWDDYGFSLGNGLYTDIGSLLDDRFTVAQNLTYHM